MSTRAHPPATLSEALKEIDDNIAEGTTYVLKARLQAADLATLQEKNAAMRLANTHDDALTSVAKGRHRAGGL